MITIQHEGSLTVIGVFARLEIADFRQLEEEVALQLRTMGKVDFLVDLRGMIGYTLDTVVEDIRFTREHAHDVGRVAILSEQDSVVWTTLLSRLFVQAELRVFDSEAEAREWLGARETMRNEKQAKGKG